MKNIIIETQKSSSKLNTERLTSRTVSLKTLFRAWDVGDKDVKKTRLCKRCGWYNKMYNKSSVGVSLWENEGKSLSK